MGIEMEDTTGQPRSDEDLQETLRAVGKTMLNPLSVPAELGIYLTDIRAFLQELQLMRNMLKEARERREAQEGR